MDIGFGFNVAEQSVISSSTSIGAGEASYLNSCISGIHSNYSENDNYDASVSKFKGVVKLPNGHWGAQINSNHHRIWLGTFESENEAAMAYDSKALKLRNADFEQNFLLNDMTIHEPNFQDHYTSEAVLHMIKDGSYPFKFSNYLLTQVNVAQSLTLPPLTCRPLFQKELTPSDVSRLNRLVIPKKYALEYFPQITDLEESNGFNKGNNDEVELEFFDLSMRSWRFRYSYWKSSQSFVFTRGWNKFVKEKGLKAKDRIIFSGCDFGHGPSEVRTLSMIDVYYDGGNGDDIGQPAGDSDRGEEVEEMDVQCGEDENVANLRTSGGNNGFRLFGVEIK